MSLSIIIATIGRPTLAATLASILPQFDEHVDEILVGADDRVSEVRAVCEASSLPCNVLDTKGPHGDWGAAARNELMAWAVGDWLLFIDDDDVYLPNGLNTMRDVLSGSPWFPHVFRVKYQDHLIWHTFGKLEEGNLTTCGIAVPNTAAKIGKWTQRYACDFDFFSECCRLHGVAPVWSADVVSQWRPQG